jgi:PleD family two-component response regulator
MALAEGMVSVTLSIGIATSDMAGEIHGLLSAADTALYRAKHRGRNCLELATTEDVTHGYAVKGLVG